jgi:hypothetical protein
MFIQDNGADPRMILGSQEFRRTVAGAIRHDNDLLDVWVVKLKKMQNLTPNEQHTIVYGEYDTHAGSDRANTPRPWSKTRKQPHDQGIAQVRVKYADER